MAIRKAVESRKAKYRGGRNRKKERKYAKKKGYRSPRSLQCRRVLWVCAIYITQTVFKTPLKGL